MSEDFSVEMTAELKVDIFLDFLDTCGQFGGFLSEMGEALEKFAESVQAMDKDQIEHILGHFIEGLHTGLEKWGQHLTATGFSVGKFDPEEIRERINNDPNLSEEEREHMLWHLEESFKVPDNE